MAAAQLKILHGPKLLRLTVDCPETVVCGRAVSGFVMLLDSASYRRCKREVFGQVEDGCTNRNVSANGFPHPWLSYSSILSF